jgi:hypothetical protein
VRSRADKVAAKVSQAQLGRSQAVRQRILIPPFGGSIPPAPATQSLDLRLWLIYTRIPHIFSGIRVYLDSLHAPNIDNLGENIPKVSGSHRRNSRF